MQLRLFLPVPCRCLQLPCTWYMIRDTLSITSGWLNLYRRNKSIWTAFKDDRVWMTFGWCTLACSETENIWNGSPSCVIRNGVVEDCMSCHKMDSSLHSMTGGCLTTFILCRTSTLWASDPRFGSFRSTNTLGAQQYKVDPRAISDREITDMHLQRMLYAISTSVYIRAFIFNPFSHKKAIASGSRHTPPRRGAAHTSGHRES